MLREFKVGSYIWFEQFIEADLNPWSDLKNVGTGPPKMRISKIFSNSRIINWNINFLKLIQIWKTDKSVSKVEKLHLIIDTDLNANPKGYWGLRTQSFKQGHRKYMRLNENVSKNWLNRNIKFVIEQQNFFIVNFNLPEFKI